MAERELHLVDPTSPDETRTTAPDLDLLLGKVSRGDNAAFATLYDQLSGSVHGLALRVVRDPARAEEVTQDVFLEVWKNSTRFDRAKGKAKTWILTIAHRRAVDAVRRSESLKRADHHSVADEVSHDEPAESVIRQDEHQAVRSCLETLTELQLESVRLAYFNGYSYPEVAALLDRPLPTIKTRMRDGLIRLRDCLSGEER